MQVQLPEAAVGDQVVASIEDGGRFSDGKPVESFTLDESRQIGFQFPSERLSGHLRVTSATARKPKLSRSGRVIGLCGQPLTPAYQDNFQGISKAPLCFR